MIYGDEHKYFDDFDDCEMILCSRNEFVTGTSHYIYRDKRKQYDPEIPLIGMYPREMKTYAHTKKHM